MADKSGEKAPSRRLRQLEKENADLRRSLSRFQALLEHTDDFILISDERGRPLVWNSAYAAIMKRSLGIDMTPGLQPHSLLEDPERKAWWENMHRRVLSGERFREEYEHTLPGGESMNLEISYNPIREGERVVGFLEITRDITRRRRAQAALQAGEERLRLFFEHAPIGVAIVAPDLQILSVNPAVCRMLDTPAEDLETRSLRDLLTRRDLERLLEGVRSLTRDVIHLDLLLQRRDGTPVNARAVVSLVRDPARQVRFAVAMVTDITERLALEERLRHVHKMEAVGTLAAGIAHDFNNILGIILGNVDLVMDEVPDWSVGRDCLGDIRGAALRARQIVRQILTFGRHTRTETAPLELTGAVRNALRLARAGIPADVEVREDLRAERDVVETDPNLINQLVVNLCSNAADAMRDSGGTLTVSLENRRVEETGPGAVPGLAAGEYAELRVTDTGHGIAPEIRDRIFDPYFSTRARGEGAGMGLAVVHGIVTAAKGVVTAAAGPGGRGTVITVLLPLSAATLQVADHADPGQFGGREHILFVDDEPFLAKLGKRLLEPLGYRVDARTDSREALELFRKAPEDVDLVVTDMAMPNQRGDRLAAAMMRIRPDVPIILCTGHSEVMDEEKALSMGIRAFLLKPFDRETLAAAVRRVLDGEGKG